MTRNLLSALLTLSLAACGLGPADEFANASPSRQGIEIKVPAPKGQALTADDVGTNQSTLLGETAEWYKNTRAMTLAVNGATAWVLKLCETIVSYPATTVTKNQAVWGPWTDSLSPNTFKFTVTKNADGTFDYVLEGKAKTAPDTGFVSIIRGHHERGAAEKVGKGNFSVDWNAASTLPEHGPEVGTADFTYQRNEKMDVTVGVAFRQVKDGDTGNLVDADYAFAKANGADGSFEFVVHKDIQNNNSKLERCAVKSRWHDNGPGRADLMVSGGDVANPVTASECWDANFGRTFYSDSLSLKPTEGVETNCTFSSAEYTQLSK